MPDLQNILALTLVTLAAAYVLKCVMAACGFQKSADRGTPCGNCSRCSGSQPAIVELQVMKSNQPKKV